MDGMLASIKSKQASAPAKIEPTARHLPHWPFCPKILIAGFSKR